MSCSFRVAWLLLLIGCLASCQAERSAQDALFVKAGEPLVRVNFIDHNGLSETITSGERLKELSQRNFLDPQPYCKVLRAYGRGSDGSVRMLVTSYYDNGQIRQYLECVNGRACGLYEEWHTNGLKKLQARVLSGQVDLDEKAFPTWSFDGDCVAWDEEGRRAAVFRYHRGVLHGLSETFYPSGAVEETMNYERGLKEGSETWLLENGTPIQLVTYHEGERHGSSVGYHHDKQLAWKEEYERNSLKSGEYFDESGKVLSCVVDGAGIRSVFDEGRLVQQETVLSGRVDGLITVFSSDGSIERTYRQVNGRKHGQEVRYYPGPVGQQRSKLSVEWKDGAIHGVVKTWYPTGTPESRREYCQNMKQGVSTAWYADGSVMLVEEYNDDKLVRGRYHRPGDTEPHSLVDNGQGTATLFDEAGGNTETIVYLEGHPQVEGS